MAESDDNPYFLHLYRFLYLGSKNLFPPLLKYHLNEENRDIITSLINSGLGPEVVDVLRHFFRDNLYLNIDTIIYAFSICLLSKNVETVEAAKRATMEICSSASSLLILCFFYKESAKPAVGWGKSYRKLITKWYNNKDPKDLIKEITKVKSRHNWTHKDVLKYAHVKPKSTDLSVVQQYITHGIEKTEKDFSDKPEVQNLLNYIRGIHELKHTTDSHLAARLIEMHDIEFDQIPISLLNSKEILLCLIPRVSLQDLLNLLPCLSKFGLLGMHTPYCKAVLERLNNENVLVDQNIGPLESFLAIRKWQKNNELIPGRQARQSTPAIDEALQNLHTASFKMVAATEKRYLVALDVRLTMNLKRCVGSYYLAPSHISNIILMALVRAEVSNVTSVIFSEKGILPVDIDNKMSLNEVVEALGKVDLPELDIVAPLHWALENKKAFDVFVVFTDDFLSTDYCAISKALNEYQTSMELPKARFVISALCTSKNVLPNTEPNILELVGFHVKLLKIIQDFACGLL